MALNAAFTERDDNTKPADGATPNGTTIDTGEAAQAMWELFEQGQLTLIGIQHIIVQRKRNYQSGALQRVFDALAG